MSDNRVVLKPLASIVRTKSPCFKNAKVYAPAELVLTEAISSVAAFERDTLAPLIRAPLGSVTVPWIPPVEIVVCENAGMASPRTATSIAAGTLILCVRSIDTRSPLARMP